MKMLVERTPVATGDPFDLDAVKLHLRAPDDSEDAAIRNIALTAASDVEHFAQVGLLTQTIQVTILGPDLSGDAIRLPVGPLDTSEAVSVTFDGVAFTGFEALPGRAALIWWTEDVANLSPDKLVITYQAGFGATADDVPSDLAQALMDQAALHYDGRSPMDAKSLTTSPHMARVGAKYRGVLA